VKSWIQTRIRNKVKIQDLERLKIEQWTAVDVHNGGLEAPNGALESLLTSGLQFPITDEELDVDPDPA
jgi:hypothetical protein